MVHIYDCNIHKAKLSNSVKVKNSDEKRVVFGRSTIAQNSDT